VGARVEVHRVPLLPDVERLAAAGFVPGGSRRNLEALADYVRWSDALDEPARLIMADAQTSGGLLISVPAERQHSLLEQLGRRGAVGSVVGEVVAGAGIEVV
jgi:selenide,water dikinase